MLTGEGSRVSMLRSLWITGTVAKVPVTDPVSISMMLGRTRPQLSSSLLLRSSGRSGCFTLALKTGVLSRGKSDDNGDPLDQVVCCYCFEGHKGGQ